MSNAVRVQEYETVTAEELVKRHHNDARSPIRREMIAALDNNQPVHVVTFEFPWVVSDNSQPEKGVWTEWQKEEGIMLEVDGQQHVVFSDRHDYHQDIEIYPERLPEPPTVVREATLQDISTHEFQRRAEVEKRATQREAFAAKQEAQLQENASKWTEDYDAIAESYGRAEAIYQRLSGLLNDLPPLKLSISRDEFEASYQRVPASGRVISGELFKITSLHSRMTSGIQKGEKLTSMLEKQQRVAPHLLNAMVLSDRASRKGFDFTNNAAMLEIMQQAQRNAMLLDKGYMISVDGDEMELRVNVTNVALENIIEARIPVNGESLTHVYNETRTHGEYDEFETRYDVEIELSTYNIDPDAHRWAVEVAGKEKSVESLPSAVKSLLGAFTNTDNPLTPIGIGEVTACEDGEVFTPDHGLIENAMSDFYVDHYGSEPLSLELDSACDVAVQNIKTMQFLEKHFSGVMSDMQTYASKSEHFNPTKPSRDNDSDDLAP